MNRIDEEDDSIDLSAVIATDDTATFTLADQFPSVQPAPQCNTDSIYPSKQTSNTNEHSKGQPAHRPTSLSPTRHSSPSSDDTANDVRQRRRYASDSTTNHIKNIPASLVISFLRHLRNELRATSDKNNGYHHVKPNSLERTILPQTSIMSVRTSNENIAETSDNNEILTLIDLLVLRVECLANEANVKKKKATCPTVAEVDQNLIEYLYYLFTKFINDEAHAANAPPIPAIDKSNFVNVCQTLVRNGCFDIPPGNIPVSPDQSSSETASSSSDKTITPQASVREYHPDTDTMMAEKSSVDGENLSTTSAEQETWLVVDLEEAPSEDSIVVSEGACQLTLSPSDEQLLITNDNYRSFESESTPSVYLSPNSSSFDLQNTDPDIEAIINNITSTVVNEEGPSTNVEPEASPESNMAAGASSATENGAEPSEQADVSATDRMSRREKRMQERWSVSTKTDTNDPEQAAAKPLLTVEFPPIAVLKRKCSPAAAAATAAKDTNETTDSSLPTRVEEINTSPPLIMVNETNPEQTAELPSEDTSTPAMADAKTSVVDEQLPLAETVVICLSEEEMPTSTEQGPLLSTTMECHTEKITNINNDSVENQASSVENSSPVITNPSDSNSMCSLPPSSPPHSPSPASFALTTDENKTIESSSKEHDEEKIEEEQRCTDDQSVDEEKKNTSGLVHDNHAPGIILINDEPAQTALLQQEKREIETEKEEEEEEEREKERPSSPLPAVEQFNQQRTEDESPVQTLSNDLNSTPMATTDDNEERFKKVEIEEVPDDEEVLSTQHVDSVEPTDYILTDDEPKQSKQSTAPSNPNGTQDELTKSDDVYTCYEKALSKVVDVYDESVEPSLASAKESLAPAPEPANDPIALRALQRFEERMNAAAASKTGKDDTGNLAARGKSPWSTSRKSLENLLKDEDQQLRITPLSLGEEQKKTSGNSHIRPRKTFDDTSLNYGTILNLYNTTSSTVDKIDHEDQKSDKEQQPSTIIDIDDKRVVDNSSTIDVDAQDQQNEEKHELIDESTNSNESQVVVEEEHSTFDAPVFADNSEVISAFDAGVSESLATSEQPDFAPYHFQIEGRRRLNTVERMRDRQNRDSLVATEQPQQQIQSEYTLKPEEVQDPIIRRALERFDEKNRSLAQTKSMNYDEIQDPITRRALMRLESNLKRTIPPPTTNDSNEHWYTESYTLGSLQPANDRLSRYNDSSQPSAMSSNKSKYNVSVHQRYGSSNDSSESTGTNQGSAASDHNIPIMRVPAQPIYVTSNNFSQQQELQPLSLRQRSRSEDMLASRDLALGPTTNLDEVDTSNQLQRNRSSNEIALNESSHLLPTTLIKTLEPHFVRTTESSVTYATPTQTYSAYSCEYTRPRRNAPGTTSETSTTFNAEANALPLKYSYPSESPRPSTYRPSAESQYPSQPSSAFAPVRSAAATTTAASNYYSQQSLPMPSYGSAYTSNSLSQAPYSEDPIVRRALERFNSQVQGSLLSTSQYPPTNNYLSHQGNLHDNWANSNRSTLMTTSTSSNSSAGGYQSIIGRRRQTRHDDPNTTSVEHSSIGDGYSSSLFGNAHNAYSSTSQYMNMPDEPPAIPPRFRRETYRTDDVNEPYRRHSVDDYLSENVNNNNNNTAHHTNPRETYIHHAYPATITNSSGFRPIDVHYNHQYESYNHSSHEHDDRTHSPSSIHSSDSNKQQQRSVRPSNIRAPMSHLHRLPPPAVSARTSTQPNGRKPNEQLSSHKMSPDHSQASLGQAMHSNGNPSGDSVFHRLAYTGTKASLSKSNSNSCSNLLHKNGGQGPSNNLKSCEIDFDDSTKIIETNDSDEQMSALNNKCQRSKSVDGRARLRLAQARANNNQTVIDNDEHDMDDEQRVVPSSRFVPVNGRRDAPPPRVPLTPTNAYRTSSLKRPGNGTSLAYVKDNSGVRTQSYSGDGIDLESQQHEIENEENLSYHEDNYQPKILENRLRTAIPVHRYTNNNHIQPSQSASAVSAVTSRIKPPTMIPVSLEKKDSNSSISDISRMSRRSDEQRRVSPPGQRRNVPVSVFSPAKLENKRPAPAPPTFNHESQQQLAFSARLSAHENTYTGKQHDHELDTKSSSIASDLKPSPGNPLNDFASAADKHDTTTTNNKKMNVFERLFRGNKKKT